MSHGDDDVRRCIHALRRHRVGGTFWGMQPTLAAARPVVLRPRDLEQCRAMQAAAGGGGVPWFPGRAAHRAAGSPKGAIVGACDPWHVLGGTAALWTDSDDPLALLAAVAGTPHRSFGADVGEDRRDPVERLGGLLAGTRFMDPFSGATLAPCAFVELLGFWRRLIDANRPIGPVYGVARWKRPSVAALLWNGAAPVAFRHRGSDARRDPPAAIGAWIARTPAATLRRARATAVPLYQIEDGFIRSVGLGAECVPPLSIVVDPTGAHYDPAQASGLERLLADGGFSAAVLDRAARLRTLIVERGISKYGRAREALVRPADGRRHVLVTGQAEDDQSVLKGGGGLTSNLELLRRVRAIEPESHILYRPHPDVERGHRKGHIDDATTLAVADEIARAPAIGALIEAVDHVHVLTSLTGFEALLRGRPVTTHGVPFYAGWGLTTDLGPVPARRGRVLSLDELVAATLLLYPRYLDPLTGLPCPAETLVERIAQGYAARDGALVRLRRRLGDLARVARKLPLRR